MITPVMSWNVAPSGKQRRTPHHGGQPPDRTYHRDTGDPDPCRNGAAKTE